jgi:hypothetical protein
VKTGCRGLLRLAAVEHESIGAQAALLFSADFVSMDRQKAIQKQIMLVTDLHVKLAAHRSSRRPRDGKWRHAEREMVKKLAKAHTEVARLQGEGGE